MAGLASEVIKEYLVSLGFKVDEKSLGSFNSALQKAQVGVKTYVAAMSALAVGVAKFVSSMYQKDLQLERDAKSTRKSIEATRAYTNALKAMGVTADQIKKDSKLKALSNELQALGKEMALPKGSEAISTVRDLMNEFTKFKYVGTYVLDWINYKFKTLAGVQLKGITDSLKSFRLRIQTNMPKISTGIATAMKFVASAVNSVLRVVNGVFSLIDRIPDRVKLVIGAIAGAIAVIKAGPLGRIGALLAAITLLLDDFFVHMDGGEAVLGPFWDDCLELFDTLKTSIGDAITKLKENGTLGSIWTSLQEIATSSASAINSIVTAIFGSETGNDSRFQKFGDLLSNTIQVAAEAIADALEIMATGLEWVAKILDKANEMGILDDALRGIAISLGTIAALKGLDKAAGFLTALKGLSGKGLSGWGKTVLEKAFPNLTTLFGGKKGAGQSAAETAAETAGTGALGLVKKLFGVVKSPFFAAASGLAVGNLIADKINGPMHAGDTAEDEALVADYNKRLQAGRSYEESMSVVRSAQEQYADMAKSFSNSSQKVKEAMEQIESYAGSGGDLDVTLGQYKALYSAVGNTARMGAFVEGNPVDSLKTLEAKIKELESGLAQKESKEAAKDTQKAADDTKDAAKDTKDASKDLSDTSDDMSKSADQMKDDVSRSADSMQQNVTTSVDTSGQQVVEAINTYGQNVVNLVEQGAQMLVDSLSSIASSAASAAGGKNLNAIPTQQMYSNGGVVWGQQSVTVGENNDPEAIIPLNKPRRALELLRYSLGYMGITPQSLLGAQAMLGASGAGNAIPAYAGASASGHGNVYHNTSNTRNVQAPVNMNVYGSDASATAHATANILQRRWMHNVQGVILA